MRVVNPEGEDVPVGEVGEIAIQGHNIMTGYWNNREATTQAIPDGWFRTGDLAAHDGHGHTMFKGRLKETLRISHFMVAPGEIEMFLMSHPDVEQAFVVGIPDPVANEVPAAYVILRPHARLTEDALRAYCHGKIASFKIPKMVRFVSDVPRTPSPHGDKVQRVKLRQQALKELGQ